MLAHGHLEKDILKPKKIVSNRSHEKLHKNVCIQKFEYYDV